ncbi:uncharacterized protein LOC105697980 [Orussus abietinus]|uniref:uncharacterized protein LOC105697980 n=1 Tax=Orussus abietinus TaxID=222816 RepID=UPI0006256674|nr:uncharacterized protein LOC105697980 [Orussus abietinus]
MWKFVTRGIRETLERRACRTNVYSQTSQDGNSSSEVKTGLACNYKFLPPAFVTYKSGFCGYVRDKGAKGERRNSQWNAKRTWTEAVGWSSVLAVGWVVCQSLCLHRRLFSKDPEEASSNNILQTKERKISYLLAQILSLQPQHVLPVTNCVGNSNNKTNDDNVSEQQWRASKPFGPITVEEALQEAANEFAQTHITAMGEYALLHGIKALEDKRYKDALEHFSEGAKFSSPGSIFNLGLCHELGLGTVIDCVKAAKYYEEAANKGHADAMYNLGVYYAQGRGGVSMDLNRARSLFTNAAQLGQVNAQHALSLEKSISNCKHSNMSATTNVSNQRVDRVKDSICSKNSILDQLTDNESEYSFDLNASSSERIQEIHDSTKLLLDFLGLHDTNPVPITVSSQENLAY